jgi:hypothetical protein
MNEGPLMTIAFKRLYVGFVSGRGQGTLGVPTDAGLTGRLW